MIVRGCSNQTWNGAPACPDHRAHHRPDQLADCSRAQNSESASQSDWKSARQMLKGVFVWRYGPAAALVSLWGAHAPLNRSYQVVPSPPWPVLASPRSPVPSVLSDRARTACTGYEHSLDEAAHAPHRGITSVCLTHDSQLSDSAGLTWREPRCQSRAAPGRGGWLLAGYSRPTGPP